MSEAETVDFEPTFNRSIKLRSRDDRITSNAGVLLIREADHRLGLVESIARRMHDPRKQEWVRYDISELLRERIYSLCLNYRASDDVDLLAHDAVMRMAVWDRPGEHVLEERLASQPTQSRLLDILASFKGNLEAVRSALPQWIERHLRTAGQDHAVLHGTIDVDGMPIETHGLQPGAAYNGYYKKTVYYPLVAGFTAEGDYDSARLGDGFVHAILRKGNAAGAEGASRFIRTAYRRCSRLAKSLDVRMDAAFTIGGVMDALREDGIRFVGRLRSNEVLERLAEPHVSRPQGRPPKEGYEYTIELGEHQAESWKHAYRLVLVVVDKPDPKTGQLEFFPRYFFLITTWKREEKNAEQLLEHYRRRGTFEDRIGEFVQTTATSLSSPRFEENEASFLLSLLAFNLNSMLRGELEDETGNGWDLGRVQTSVLKAGGRVIKAGRRLVVELAQAVVPLWNLLVARIRRWALPARWAAPRGPIARDWMPPPAHAHLHAVLRT
jgi:DDE family transposase